ncbi:MAG: LysR family transcriptional regulator [Eubacteriales bacterium]|nr:LysR family transcriptional regulator [Eubacteriales bacterium]
MLDTRHQTFLTLAACGSFTGAAALLHLTQPAVSQHIRYLEEAYGCRLVERTGRKTSLTPQGELLRQFATTVSSDARALRETMLAMQPESMRFSFGATLSIGEYVMPGILSSLLIERPDMKINMAVANTHVLLDRLNHGELDFILLEGLFDKAAYDATLFSLERFIPVCSPLSPLARGRVTLEEISGSRLILRESGSGTREIFGNILQKYNYSLHAFEKVTEIGNMAAIKKMVSMDLGITFLFEAAAKKEIDAGELAVIDIPGFDEQREFNFVFLKNSFFGDRYRSIFELLKKHYELWERNR